MIYSTNFSINNNVLKLKSEEDLDIIHKAEIQGIINIIEKDFNHNIEDSLSYLFNSQYVGEERNFPEYFIKFLELNFKLSKSYLNNFKPFLPKDIQLDGLFSIEGNLVKKNRDFVLDTSILRKSFLIDYISEHIKSFGLNNFLIQFQNNFVAVGEKNWIITHEYLKGTYNISNEAILIDSYLDKKIIISTDSASINKIEFDRFPVLKKEGEFENYAIENNLKFILIDSEDNIYKFPKD